MFLEGGHAYKLCIIKLAFWQGYGNKDTVIEREIVFGRS